MHRPFTLFAFAALIPCAWVNDASAQDAASYGDPYAERGATCDQPDADREPPIGNWIRDEEYGLIWVPSRALVGASLVAHASRGSWRHPILGWMLASGWDRDRDWTAPHCRLRRPGPIWWRERAWTGPAGAAGNEWHCRASG